MDPLVLSGHLCSVTAFFGMALSLFCQASYLYSKENLLLWENDRVQCDAIMMVRNAHETSTIFKAVRSGLGLH